MFEPDQSNDNFGDAVRVEHRPLGDLGFSIAPVGLGCWPIAGVTTLDTNEADSLATIRACFDLGINHLDTAYAYGLQGESETLIGRATAGHRDELVLATKCGIHWEGKEIVNCGRPEVLRTECEASLRRLATDHVELLYLHGVDPEVPLEESAGALREMLDEGKTRSVGICNVSVDDLERFEKVCPITAVQLPFNMLQREIEQRIVPWCQERGIAVIVYWVLMKGLLAGRLPRDHQFAEGDSRRKYPMYQGDQWQRNQDFVDSLREIADRQRCTVAQLVVAWTIRQPGITTALCGAKRPGQIQETAAAMNLEFSDEVWAEVDRAIADRGPAEGKRVIA